MIDTSLWCPWSPVDRSDTARSGCSLYPQRSRSTGTCVRTCTARSRLRSRNTRSTRWSRCRRPRRSNCPARPWRFHHSLPASRPSSSLGSRRVECSIAAHRRTDRTRKGLCWRGLGLTGEGARPLYSLPSNNVAAASIPARMAEGVATAAQTCIASVEARAALLITTTRVPMPTLAGAAVEV